MEIGYYGHSCFSLRSKTAKVLCDPFDSQRVGINIPRIESDIVTVSHQHADHNAIKVAGERALVIDWPGEFEKQEVKINGILSDHGNGRGENIIFNIEIDGINVVHCGDLGVTLTNDKIERLGNVDVLLIPVGGKYTLEVGEAAMLVKSLEPKIVIPMHYRTSTNSDKFADIEPVDVFINKLGLIPETITKKLLLKKDDLPETLKLIVMEF